MENTYILEHDNERIKLMKKTKRRLISFLFINIANIVLFIIFQSNPLFLLRINRSPESLAAYGSYHLISIILLIVIGLYLLSYLYLVWTYFINKSKNVDTQTLKKRYNFFDFFSVIPVFFIVMMVLNGWFFTLAVVDGPSMEPTYYTDDVVLIGYQHAIEKDDVIVFENDKLFIKRVVGMPGDELVIVDHQVYINDEWVAYSFGSFTYDGTIGQGYYFVLGDNRDNSKDSREIGLIPKDKIVGTAILDLT